MENRDFRHLQQEGTEIDTHKCTYTHMSCVNDKNKDILLQVQYTFQKCYSKQQCCISVLSWLKSTGRATQSRCESVPAMMVQSHVVFHCVWVSVPFTTSDSKAWIIRCFIIITLCLPQEHGMGVATAPTSFSSNVWADQGALYPPCFPLS